MLKESLNLTFVTTDDIELIISIDRGLTPTLGRLKVLSCIV